ncbi:MAG TPA: hypothetical protein VFE62_16340 [Gemmataceae bacterium]|nr:hypothetical protein [Gemmataceae bacterium]
MSKLLPSIAMSLALLVPSLACAEDAVSVRLPTTDGVTLRGEFHPGTKKSACVLLLHDLGEERHEKQWQGFAKMLAAQGFAVLQFDFRGQGRSTEVEPEVFWSNSYAANRRLVKNSGNKEEIAFQSFSSSYHPYLINDIAAAKAFLDRKNDAGLCNSGNLIVISSGRSGALAAGWINAEMHRFRRLPQDFFGAPLQLAETPEGVHVLCALFIDLTPNVGKSKLSLSSTLRAAAGRKVPFVFFHGRDDAAARSVAKETEKAINPGGKNELTGVTAIPGEKLSDVENRILTDKGLEKDIVRYLKQVQDERGREWEEQDTRDTTYFWRNPYAPASVIQFNQPGNNAPPFASYELFLPAR